jgi:transcriptional regulator with XRE-family HTH domain
MAGEVDTFPLRLRAAMTHRGMSIRRLAQLTSIGEPEVARYRKIRGGTVPRAGNLVKIADALECSLDYLMGRTDVIDFQPIRLRKVEAALEDLVRGLSGDPPRR